MNAQKRPKRKPSTKLTLPPFFQVRCFWSCEGEIIWKRWWKEKTIFGNKNMMDLKFANYTGGKQDDSLKYELGWTTLRPWKKEQKK